MSVFVAILGLVFDRSEGVILGTVQGLNCVRSGVVLLVVQGSFLSGVIGARSCILLGRSLWLLMGSS